MTTKPQNEQDQYSNNAKKDNLQNDQKNQASSQKQHEQQGTNQKQPQSQPNKPHTQYGQGRNS